VSQAPRNTNLIATTSAFISRSLPNVNAPINNANNSNNNDNKVNILSRYIFSIVSIFFNFFIPNPFALVNPKQFFFDGDNYYFIAFVYVCVFVALFSLNDSY
jgi:hypothetical protein